MYSCASLAEARGCPIRIFTDQSLFAAPHDFSQRTTSFIASQCQGIHQMLLSRLMLSLPISIRGSGLGRPDKRILDLRKTYMCSICLPQCGQALRPMSVSHTPDSPLTVLSTACPAFGPRKQIPSFTMSISKTHTQDRAAKLVSRGPRRPDAGVNNNTVMEWWSQTGSNRRPEACKATALPTELWPRLTHLQQKPSPKNPASIWWAWEDSNFRPHAYQARALTN